MEALNDFYIIEEEPLELQVDNRSGLTESVIESLRNGTLVLPDIAQGFADKFPFRGKVISKGDRCRYEEIKPGTRVMFARLGGMRWEEDGKQYINIREEDIHAVIS